jgi:thioredoxin-related protein
VKKFLLLWIVLFSVAMANELKTVYSYQNALYKAKKDNKLVLVMMSYKGCPVCDYMKDIVFERPAVLDYLNEHYYVVIKDIERDHYPQRFASIDSPTFFFIDPKTEKEVIEKKVGGFRPDKFLSILKTANHDEDTISESEKPDTNQTITPCPKEKPCTEKPKVTLH